MKTTWQVRIPKGRWMAGVNHFRTKVRAERFMAKWNETEIKSGGTPLTFHRFGPRIFEAA